MGTNDRQEATSTSRAGTDYRRFRYRDQGRTTTVRDSHHHSGHHQIKHS